MPTRINRRHLLTLGGAAALLMAGGRAAASTAKPPPMQVWKSPTCGCCNDWIAILQAEGFSVKTIDEGNTAARQRLGIPAKLGSCHTALIGGYAIEGHVPPREIRRLLAEKPAAVGLTVPGMPIGSPGMDGPEYGGRKDRYDVLLVQVDGSTRTFTRY